MTNSCAGCIHYKIEIDRELPHLSYPICKEFPGRANLLSFPFKNTKCSGWSESQDQYRKTLSEILNI